MHHFKSGKHYFLSVAVATATVSACSTMPEQNTALTQARSVYASAAQDPRVAGNAPLEIKQAQESLQAAESRWRDDAEQAEVEHYAYLARQRTAIAEQVAEQKIAEQTVQNAGTERSQVQLDARARELETSASELETTRFRASALEQQLAALQAQQTERGLVLTLGDVLFDVGETSLKPGAERNIGQLVDFLKQYPERSVLVEGFTDSIGNENFNLQLSEGRARAVSRALLSQGIDPQRVRAVGYGEDLPVASNDTAAGRQLNRRVEVIISKERGRVPPRSG